MADLSTLMVTLLSGGMGICGSLLSGGAFLLYQQARKPRLRFLFSADANAGYFPRKTWTTKLGEKEDHRFVLVQIANDGPIPAMSCRVFLTGIKKVVANVEQKTEFTRPRQITWDGWGFDAKLIYRYVPLTVELVSFSTSTPKWHFKVQGLTVEEEPLKDDWNGTVTYRFYLKAVADNAEPASIAIDVTYNGNYKTVAAAASVGRSLSLA